MSKTKVFSLLKTIGKFGFAFAIIGYMVASGRLDLQTVKRGFSEGGILLFCLAMTVLAFLVSLQRWRYLLQGQGIEFPFLKTLRYGWIGAFFNTTMPGAVSGDLIKAWYVLQDRKGSTKTPILTSILLDRIFGVFGLVFVSATPLLLFSSTVLGTPALQKVALFVGLLFLGVVFFFSYIMLSVWGPLAKLRRKLNFLENHKVGSVFLKAYDAWTSYRENPKILFQSLLLSMMTHFLVVVIVIFCAKALQEDNLSLYQYFLLVPVGMLTTAIPVAPAGLGVGHVAFAALFRLAGSEHGAEVFTMFVTLQILFNLCGAFFYLKSPKIKPDMEEQLGA